MKLKNYERKIKSPFITYAYFERIWVPEDNGKQNTEESYAYSYDCKLVCVDNKFCKLFKTYLGKDAVDNFINKTLKKVNINKEIEIIKEDNEDFKNPTKWWIYRNYYVDVDVKVKIMVISMENIEVLHIEIVISILD